MSFNGNLGCGTASTSRRCLTSRTARRSSTVTPAFVAAFSAVARRTVGIAGATLSEQFAATVDSIRAVEVELEQQPRGLPHRPELELRAVARADADVRRPRSLRARRPARVARSLSLSGRNLALWTSYQGFEPEAMFLGGTRGGNVAWEQTTLPQLRTWIFSFNLRL